MLNMYQHLIKIMPKGIEQVKTAVDRNKFNVQIPKIGSSTMANGKEFTKRGKHERLKVKNGAIAMIRPLNALAATHKYCQIINISKGGLAFRCIDRNGEINEPFELDVLFLQDSVCLTYLKNIPFKTVWVFNEPAKASRSHLKTKQLGIQFGEMTPQHESQLERFLEECTIK
jgi:hypothetical protein